MGARILRRRKEKGLTQEALANKLGVSNQAVSQWEGDVCCPDLQLLPLLADTLELSLDERESMAKTAQKAEADSQILSVAAELPWEDDDAIHAVLFQGHRLLQPKQGSLFRHDKYDEIRKTVELHFSGTAQEEYGVLAGAVREILHLAINAFAAGDSAAAAQVEPLEEVIDKLKEQMRTRHILRMQQGQCSIEAGFVLSDLLTDLERTSDHCSNIAGCVIDARAHNLNLHETLRQVKTADGSFQQTYESYVEKYQLPVPSSNV